MKSLICALLAMSLMSPTAKAADSGDVIAGASLGALLTYLVMRDPQTGNPGNISDRDLDVMRAAYWESFRRPNGAKWIIGNVIGEYYVVSKGTYRGNRCYGVMYTPRHRITGERLAAPQKTYGCDLGYRTFRAYENNPGISFGNRPIYDRPDRDRPGYERPSRPRYDDDRCEFDCYDSPRRDEDDDGRYYDPNFDQYERAPRDSNRDLNRRTDNGRRPGFGIIPRN